MRRLTLAATLLLAGFFAGAIATPTQAVGNFRIYAANAFACSDSSGATIVAIADSTGTFTARFLSVINDGANEAFVDFNGGTSTSADPRLDATGTAGSSFTVNAQDNGTNAISCVASSGETTTLRILAIR